MRSLTTVAELPSFRRKAAKLISAAELESIIEYLAEHPLAGDVMEGTGGVRKLRWGKGSRGKSGGVRVIYYFHDATMPLYLLTLFGKNDQADLSSAQRNELARFSTLLIEAWKFKGLDA